MDKNIHGTAHDIKSAICVCVRDEGRYIGEWVKYHFSLGFHKIIICNNDEPGDNSLEGILQDWVSARKIDIIDYQGQENFQMKAYNRCLARYGKEYDWMAFIDADEFISFADGEHCRDINAYLKEVGETGADAVYLNWKIYGDNGKIRYEEGNIVDRFPVPSVIGAESNEHIKSIVRTSAHVRFKNPHNIVRTLWSIRKPVIVNDCLQPVLKNSPRQPVSYGRVYIRHYITKTIEEYILQKVRRGAADCKSRKKYDTYTIDRFYLFNERNQEKDRVVAELM